MTSSTLEVSNLLHYNAQYGVLICRKCQYAIQKQALGRHVLRHKIYRADRQRLLSSLAHLQILEVEEVSIPDRPVAPIEGLPILDGFECTKRDCGYLCSSWKRWRRHWTESHETEDPGRLEIFIQEVKLQTFFRGTKIKYFKVDESLISKAVSAGSIVIDTIDGRKAGIAEIHKLRGCDSKALPTTPLLDIHQVESIAPSWISPDTEDLDLRTLMYFYHFTTLTSLTLPWLNHRPLGTQYWSKHVISVALRSQLIMHGLLAISAYHLLLRPMDVTDKRNNWENLIQFESRFYAEWEEKVIATRENNSEVQEASSLIDCIIKFARWAAKDEITPEVQRSSPPEESSPLNLFLTVVRKLFGSDLITSSHRNIHDTQKLQESGVSRPVRRSRRSNPGLLAAHHRLQKLPSLMTDAFRKPGPDEIQDVLATVSAIGILDECYDISIEATSSEEVWQGMVMWLTRVPDAFFDMIKRREPAAYVVLAHWVPLIRHAEQDGYWFLQGAAHSLVSEIEDAFKVEDIRARRLAIWPQQWRKAL